jgi:hypothetical protein
VDEWRRGEGVKWILMELGEQRIEARIYLKVDKHLGSLKGIPSLLLNTYNFGVTD